MAACMVSYVDTSVVWHRVEVEADSLYEAAALAIKVFKQHECEPQGLHQLDVEMRTSVTHTLTVKRLREWLQGSSKTPKEAILKERLRELL